MSALATAQPLPPNQDLLLLTNQPRLARILFPTDLAGIGAYGCHGFAFGDFDGDGIDDLVMGGSKVVTGDPEIFSEAGDVTIFHGSSYPPGATDPTYLNRPTSDSASPWEARFLGGQESLLLGRSVAVSDLNGDGQDDIIAGAPVSPGTVFLFPGGSVARGEAVYVHPTNPPVVGESRIQGDNAEKFFGSSLEGGDFNGDGFGDIAIGSPFTEVGGTLSTGRVIIIWGSAGIMGQTIDLTTTDEAVTLAGETRILASSPGKMFGYSLASGDVNGDGVDDLAIGAILEDAGETPEMGEVFIIFGSESLPATVVDLSAKGGAIAAGETRILGDDSGDFFGYSMDMADIDNDGYTDLLIGSNGAEGSAFDDSGETILINGQSVTPSSIIDLDTDGTVSPAGETRFVGVAAGDQSGRTVALVDFDGDGKSDPIIAVKAAEQTGRANPGRVSAISSNNFTHGSIVPLNPSASITNILGSASNAYLGNGLAAGGDLNDDGFADFAAAESELVVTPYTPMSFVAMGWGDSATATASFFDKPGDGLGSGVVPARKYGPVIRTTIDFADSDNASDGSGEASLTSVTLHRDNDGITPTGIGSIADVGREWWSITTNRSDWSGADVKFKYLPSKVSGLNESALQLYSASDPSGPWTLVAGQSLDTPRHSVSAPVPPFTGTRHFAIASDGAEVLVDGTLDAAYGPPIAVQTVNTSFGNNSTGAFMTSGSELDALYVINDETNLYVFLAGNLESNGNVVGVMMDNVSNGVGVASPIPTFWYAWDSWFNENRLDEGILSTGFNPDYFFGMKFFDTGGDGFADWTCHEANLLQRTEHAAPDLRTTINANPLIASHGDIAIAVNNSNAGGVANGSLAGFPFRGTDPALVQTGMEFSIPLSRLGSINPGDEIRIVALIGNYVLDFNSNQFLPPFPVPRSHAGAYPNNFNLPALGVTYASAFLKSAAATESGLDVVMTSTENSPTYQTNVPVTVRFRRPVTGFVETMISPVDATVQNFTVVDGSTYTFHLVSDAREGDISATIAGGLVQDAGLIFNRPSPPFLRHITSVPPLASGWSVR